MDVAFQNAEGVTVSATEANGGIMVRASGAGRKLKGKAAERLRREFRAVDSFEGTADYSEDEKRVIRHFLLARFVL